MENDQKGPNISGFVVKYADKIRSLEKIALPIFALGLVLYLFKQPYAIYIFIPGIFLTALVYFLLAFAFIDTSTNESSGIMNSAGFINFIYKLYYFGLAAATISFLGYTLPTNNNHEILIMGGTTLIIAVILSLFTKLKDRSVIYNSSFYMRSLIWLILLAYMVHIKYTLM